MHSEQGGKINERALFKSVNIINERAPHLKELCTVYRVVTETDSSKSRVTQESAASVNDLPVEMPEGASKQRA